MHRGIGCSQLVQAFSPAWLNLISGDCFPGCWEPSQQLSSEGMIIARIIYMTMPIPCRARTTKASLMKSRVNIQSTLLTRRRLQRAYVLSCSWSGASSWCRWCVFLLRLLLWFSLLFLPGFFSGFLFSVSSVFSGFFFHSL